MQSTLLGKPFRYRPMPDHEARRYRDLTGTIFFGSRRLRLDERLPETLAGHLPRGDLAQAAPGDWVQFLIECIARGLL